MADTAPTVAPVAAATKTPTKGSGEEKIKRGRPRNYDLGNGVYRFSRTRMYHKKAVYKFIGKKTEKKAKPVKPLTVEKKIGGEKNGETRIVLLKKRRSYYPTADKIKPHHSRKFFSQHKRYTRKTLTPGTICIVLAGPHKGKRVVLLKVLESGLLLVTGPFKINACPLRRISQNFVIATSTKLDISGVKLPTNINDKYFKRNRQKRPKKVEGDIFSTKKEVYKPSDQRKADQQVVDKEIIGVIRKHPEKKHLFMYLSAMFGLRSSQYPHRMIF